MQSANLRSIIAARRCALFLALMPCIAAYAQDTTATQPGTSTTSANAQQKAISATAAERNKAAKTAAANATQLSTVIVTAQKKSENIEKVPIAITAFSGEDLNNRKIETGADLVTATPNVSFSKTNFASYNFQIRGIGTQALSVTTDPAVAISFNDTPMIRNRLFEQEYFDVNNVEVLRGPQGTLYGRNATAGVVNMIPNLPSLDGFESWVKAEVGNYDGRRLSGMINVPLSDTMAFRFAAAGTDRSGYTHNSVTDKDVDGRTLWSGRASFLWKPSDRFDASIVWEHFSENDDRARTGKQLCHTDPGPASVNGVTPTVQDRDFMSQGCTDGSLYSPGAFGVPNGGGLPQIVAASGLAGVVGLDPNTYQPVFAITPGVNPFAGVTQSTNLRQIATTYDPIFHAKNDVIQLNLNFKVNDDLKLVSQTLYTRDRYYSSQDYGRFQSNPIFNSTDGALGGDGVSPAYPLLPGGVFCDPQLGCSNKFLEADLSESVSKQWSQEFRLQSSYDGPFNFSLGANYLDYKVDESYYVFNNVLSMLSEGFFGNGTQYGGGAFPTAPGTTLGQPCPAGQVSSGTPINDSGCVYVDPNSLSKINGQGHNYFRSKNVAETKSAAIFGEGYWQLSDTLKLTTGLRYTDDRKITTPYPSELLLTPGILGGGLVNSGYPAEPQIHQKWGEFSGRAVLDWTPQTSFTDSTLNYVSYSRGYKAGGTNSPGIGSDPTLLGFVPLNPEFKPEFINAFEIGTKNVLDGGKLTFDADVFYYDYSNYQVSQIINREAYNENFNAKAWGAEFQAAWKPTREFRLDGALGLLGTRIDSGQTSLDVMNRTQSNPDWIVVRPWVQQAANCIAPKALVAELLQAYYANPTAGVNGNAANLLDGFCPYPPQSTGGGFLPGSSNSALYGITYNPLTDAPNDGQGFSAKVGGHSLPNAPHWTASLSPQYTFFLKNNDDLILRGDFYYQGPSWARIYQDQIDRLRGWGNVNLSLTYEHPENDLTVQFYVKNALNGTAITGTFLNSDDTGLTANAFTQDPRIIGLSIRKGFY